MPVVMSEEAYKAYLVRIWSDNTRGQWRAQVLPVGVPGGEGRFFNDPAQLLVYWLGETAVAGLEPPVSKGDEQ
jgi:hypothetical protein